MRCLNIVGIYRCNGPSIGYMWTKAPLVQETNLDLGSEGFRAAGYICRHLPAP